LGRRNRGSEWRVFCQFVSQNVLVGLQERGKANFGGETNRNFIFLLISCIILSCIFISSNVFIYMATPESKKKPMSPEHQRKMKMLGQKIKALRMQQGYTSHEAFAYKHGFNRTQYFRYENGEDLRFSSLLRIVSAFDMTLEQFFAEGFE
jgi:hypothetical protein